ncbi:MAG: hypothetical protein MUC35_06510 [Candidatus Margulisbacteria bacterium]|jgi:hypothetical protein|nr:hypothetical protein [Candidatus Margulisiibacteriota bacterium]
MTPQVIDTIKEYKKLDKQIDSKETYESLLQRFIPVAIAKKPCFPKPMSTGQKEQEDIDLAYELGQYLSFDSANKLIAYLEE